jgi:hypothetical protein
MFAVSQQINCGPIFEIIAPSGEHIQNKKMYSIKVVKNNQNKIYISKKNCANLERNCWGRAGWNLPNIWSGN